MDAVSLLDAEAAEQAERDELHRQNQIEFWRIMLGRRSKLEAELQTLDKMLERKRQALQKATERLNNDIQSIAIQRDIVRRELIDAKQARARLLELASPEQRERRERLQAAIMDAQAETAQLRQAAEDARQTAATAPARFASHARSAELVAKATANAATVERRYAAAVERLDTLRRELLAVEGEIVFGIKNAE